ncbi:hypothetical protein ROLI_021650 [Roseobacter fucihabitans]|uniref:Potassium transporter TrkH n=1 Tax=Roseobacter fucihabitans TaxID=1537242 RepID=A0ABZ2BSR5_9RHOB
MQRAPHRKKQRSAFVQLMDLPLFLLIFGVASVSMFIPALHGGAARNLDTARMFFYCAILGVTFFTLIAIAHAGRRDRRGPLGSLMSLFATFVFLPAFLAIPFYEGLGTTTYLNAYVEMVSAITTTGATLFEDPERLDGTLHLWRAQVGWMGGAVMWIAASAILAPLNLGGFEVTAQAEPGQREARSSLIGRADPRERLVRVTAALLPIYIGLTVLLWVLLLASGDRPLVSLSHAMSIMATSGISPVGGVQYSGSGITGEAVMLLFMLFALSRLTFASDTVTATQSGLRTDPEFRLGILLVLGVPVILFLRHWLGALDVSAEDDIGQAAGALWGSVFTVMSFLTTTGFVSENWVQAQAWSGLETPGLILMGLALIGGGVATTAGGETAARLCALSQRAARDGTTCASLIGQQRRLPNTADTAQRGLYRMDILHALRPDTCRIDDPAGGFGGFLSGRAGVEHRGSVHHRTVDHFCC